jgi:adenine phosphoribosyltransferase
MIDLKRYVDAIPNFPSVGIVFRDISPLLRHHFSEVTESFGNLFSLDEWSSTDYVAGIEARGFVLAAAVAIRFKKGVILVRKQGKLPPPVVATKYTLEYGSGILEMKPGNGNVLVVDDVIATGGTLSAAVELCHMAGYSVGGIGALIDLKLNSESLVRGMPVRSVIKYE